MHSHNETRNLNACFKTNVYVRFQNGYKHVSLRLLYVWHFALGIELQMEFVEHTHTQHSALDSNLLNISYYSSPTILYGHSWHPPPDPIPENQKR